MSGTVYGLVDPRTDTVRYVGKTIHDIDARLKSHIYEALVERELTHKCNWIRLLHSLQLAPTTRILEKVNGDDDELAARERYWVEYGMEHGWDLTNATRGGEGARRFSASSRENLSRAQRGRTHSEETKEKIRQANTGHRHTSETIAKIIAANVGRTLSPEHREALVSSRRGVVNTAEHNKKVSEALKGRVFTESHRQKIRNNRLGTALSDETKAKISAAHMGRTVSDETRLRMSEAAKKRWQQRNTA